MLHGNYGSYTFIPYIIIHTGFLLAPSQVFNCGCIADYSWDPYCHCVCTRDPGSHHVVALLPGLGEWSCVVLHSSDPVTCWSHAGVNALCVVHVYITLNFFRFYLFCVCCMHCAGRPVCLQM